MSEFIPYGKQWIDEEDIQAVVDVLKSDYITTGPKIKEFEDKFASYVGAKFAVAFSNGTAALHAACSAAELTLGDEVITTPITFAASSNAVLYCGASPVFVDIDAKTYNIDPLKIKEAINENSKAIVAVDFTGQPIALKEIKALAEANNLVLIEDASHSLGADYNKVKVGGLADMTTFSFHPVKHITTGEGGMVTTNDSVLYNKLILFRTHGITRNPDYMEYQESECPWYYEQVDLGYNYRLTDFQCALGISQLKKIDRFVESRRAIADQYNRLLKEVSGIILPHQLEESKSSWHLYVIRLDETIYGKDNVSKLRDKLYNLLKDKGIRTNVHYIPIYHFPYYRKNGYEYVSLDNAEAYYRTCLTIPLYPKMTDLEVKTVVETIKSALKEIEIEELI